jgi:hypothetical protein
MIFERCTRRILFATTVKQAVMKALFRIAGGLVPVDEALRMLSGPLDTVGIENLIPGA